MKGTMSPIWATRGWVVIEARMEWFRSKRSEGRVEFRSWSFRWVEGTRRFADGKSKIVEDWFWNSSTLKG